MKGYRIRQVYDLPPIPDRSNGTQSRNKQNGPHCHTPPESQFPSTVPRSVQYGPYIKRLILINNYQCISLQRNKRILQTVLVILSAKEP